jgi:hypothetical protein
LRAHEPSDWGHIGLVILGTTFVGEGYESRLRDE